MLSTSPGNEYPRILANKDPGFFPQPLHNQLVKLIFGTIKLLHQRPQENVPD
jgi:hypothetical protein